MSKKPTTKIRLAENDAAHTSAAVAPEPGAVVMDSRNVAPVTIDASLVAAVEAAQRLAAEKLAALETAQRLLAEARASLRAKQENAVAGRPDIIVRARAGVRKAVDAVDDADVVHASAQRTLREAAEAVEKATRDAHEAAIKKALDDLMERLVPAGFALVREIRSVLDQCFQAQERIKNHRRPLKWPNALHETFSPRQIIVADLISCIQSIGLPLTTGDIHSALGSQTEAAKVEHLKRHYVAAALRPTLEPDFSGRLPPPSEPVRENHSHDVGGLKLGSGTSAAPKPAIPHGFEVFGR